MSNSAANKYLIDGIDIWNTFGIGIEKGSDDFLKIPARKESTTHDWADENGIDVDLTRTFFKHREGQLKMFMLLKEEFMTIPEIEATFWSVYNGFINLLSKPGTRRLEIIELSRQFFVYYKDNNVYERFTRIKGTNVIATKFTITVVETRPSINNTPTYIITENGKFLIA